MKRNNLISKRERGMTLLEVLVALAIFATAAISVIRAVTQHINTLSYLEEKTLAAMVVDNQMAMVMLHPEKLKKTQGTQKLAERDWFWTVTPVATSDNLLKAFDVSVATSKNASPVVTVRSYVSK
ncbi:type II secretion system minor pseudopilin GspI [Vibrio sp. Isolate30]|uniref:type II secretion system minor pseudopilin GspI n=1 Tax=Vibrio sp. Isolate30 TaxID=2908536 RepID=UPI001EFDF9E5|nr:type II secretion system minor pseudopilin GspI [Vibrio sp. Isolate30]MCG9632556.1 type II secretion system minor pseudopilin GspI [Vibrio sp. Isolate30]